MNRSFGINLWRLARSPVDYVDSAENCSLGGARPFRRKRADKGYRKLPMTAV
jgi:hypothetical protein